MTDADPAPAASGGPALELQFGAGYTDAEFGEWWDQFGRRLTVAPEMLALAAFAAGKGRLLERIRTLDAEVEHLRARRIDEHLATPVATDGLSASCGSTSPPLRPSVPNGGDSGQPCLAANEDAALLADVARLRATPQGEAGLRRFLDSEPFYDLMQTYRHTPAHEQAAVVAAYELVKSEIILAALDLEPASLAPSVTPEDTNDDKRRTL